MLEWTALISALAALTTAIGAVLGILYNIKLTHDIRHNTNGMIKRLETIAEARGVAKEVAREKLL